MIGRTFGLEIWRADDLGHAPEIQPKAGLAISIGQTGKVELRAERGRIGVGQLDPLPDIGFVAGFLLALIEPYHQVFLLVVQRALQLRRGAGAGGRHPIGDSRLRARRGGQQIDVVSAVVVEPALRSVQLLAQPFDPVTRAEPAIAIVDDTHRHRLALVVQRKLGDRTAGKPRLLPGDTGVVERVDAGILDFDVQRPAAGECGRRQQAGQERDAARQAGKEHYVRVCFVRK